MVATETQEPLYLRVIRDESAALNRFAKFTKCPAPWEFCYPQINNREAVLIDADGTRTPGGGGVEIKGDELKRYAYGFHMEDGYDPAPHYAMHASKALAVRSVDVAKLLAEFPRDIGHVKTARLLAGDYLDRGTPINPLLKVAAGKALVRIETDTLGRLELSDVLMVVNPNTARALAKSDEVMAYMAGGPAEVERLRSPTHPNYLYGLPSALYGQELVIDTATKVVVSQDGRRLKKTFDIPDGTIAFLARPGGRAGEYGKPTLATISIFWHGEDELTAARDDGGYYVQDSFKPVYTCPLSGFLVTNAVAPI